jgi:UPF0755 protein
MTNQKKNRFQSCLMFLFIFSIIGLLIGLFWLWNSINREVIHLYGEPEKTLSFDKKIFYTTKIYFSGEKLLEDQNNLAEDYFFEILPGETVGQISYRLKMNRLIKDSDIFKDYLIYRGFDRRVQSGYFRVTPEMNGIEIAEKITNPIPDKVRFIILPGWRVEEVASTLQNSGLAINPDEFLAMANNPSPDWLPPGFENLRSLEGYLYPGEYLVDREISSQDLVQTILNNFREIILSEYAQAFESQGLNLHEALIFASIVEREAVVNDEMPMIASVFLNRYAIGMKLDSDPTVQYAAGYNITQATWWTNPLSLQDLRIDSPFNTYIYNGLPPHPICNPSITAIQSVAFPAESTYYYFRARCDNSGRHNFAETYEEHLANGCP